VAGRVAPPPLNDDESITAKENLLEFWLRMGFEEVSHELMDNPLEGIFDLPIPQTLKEAAKTISDTTSINSAENRGKELCKSKAAKPRRTMGPEKYAAVLLYTGNSIYRALNQALRVDHHLVKKYFNYIRLLLEAMGCMTKQKGQLWRGIAADLYDEYEPGKIITWWSVSSCTSDQNVTTLPFSFLLASSAAPVPLHMPPIVRTASRAHAVGYPVGQVARNFMSQVYNCASLSVMISPFANAPTRLILALGKSRRLPMPGDLCLPIPFPLQLGGGATFLTLEVQNAVDISPLSFYASEKESLLAPGTQLEVVSRKRNGKIAEIVVKEVGSMLE